MSTRTRLAQRGLYGVIVSCTLMLLGVSLAPAHAADDSTTRVVRYAPVDLASDAGAQQLLRRIEVASHEVCADQDRAPLTLHEAARRCYLSAVARAVDALGSPHLKALYLARYRTGAPAAPAHARTAPAARSKHG